MGRRTFTQVLCVVFVLALSSPANSAPYRVASSKLLATSLRSDSGGVLGSITCDICGKVVEFIQYLFSLDFSEDTIVDLVADLCTTFHIDNADETVCHGLAHLFKDEVLTVFAKTALSPKEVCGAVIGSSCGSEYDPFHQKWNITIPGNKPPVYPVPAPIQGAPVTRIVHLSDIHYDFLYREGLSNDCGEPLCCRIPNKQGSGATAAGRWGDYNCDVPNRTLVNLFEHLHNISDQFDWVYWTGDLPAHNVWSSERSKTLEIMNNITQMMQHYLPNKLIFPAVGNHEGVPVNSFPPPFITGDNSNDWLYTALLQNWTHWLSQFPDWNTTQQTILRGGFYNVKVREGLRVISVETNFCNTEDWWLLINATDPAGHLKWLVEQLQAAEDAGDKVHIIGHIPPGEDACLPPWSWNYGEIVNRYESTIMGQFYGHTHHDEFELFFEQTRPTSVAYIGHGLTSYTDLNFGFRIYTIDGDYNTTTSAVLDHENYIMNITKANLYDKPEWEWEYSAKKTYSMEALQPEDWLEVVKKFQTDEDLFMKYYQYNWKMHSPSTCDSHCKSSSLCDLVKARSGDRSMCGDFLSEGVTIADVELYSKKRQSC